MSENNKEVKEIDLLELFSIMGRGLKNAFLSLIRAIFFLITFGIKNTHWIALSVIIGGIIGLLLYNSSPRYYSSNLIAQTNGISATDMTEYINELHKYTKNSNTPAIANSLEIPDSIASQIKNIEAFYFLDVNKDGIGDIVDFENTYNAVDTNIKIDEKKIYLQVEVFSNQIFNKVKEGLFHYIAKNEYLIKLNKIRVSELEELVSFTDKEVQILDSLQKLDYFNLNNEHLGSSNEKGVFFLSEKDKQMYYYNKESLIRKKQEYIKELEMATQPLTIIKDFAQLTKEENPKGGYIFKFGFWFGVITYIVLIFYTHRSKLTILIS